MEEIKRWSVCGMFGVYYVGLLSITDINRKHDKVLEYYKEDGNTRRFSFMELEMGIPNKIARELNIKFGL